MNTMWAVSLSGLLGKMTRTHPRSNLVTNANNLILKKLEYVMKVGFIKMISSISMCSSLIKEVSHFLQGSSTLTKYCSINIIRFWFIGNLKRAIEKKITFTFDFCFYRLQTTTLCLQLCLRSWLRLRCFCSGAARLK